MDNNASPDTHSATSLPPKGKKNLKKKKKKKLDLLGACCKFPIGSSRIFYSKLCSSPIWQRQWPRHELWGWSAQGGPHPIESSKQHMDFIFIFWLPSFMGDKKKKKKKGGGGPGFRGTGGDVPFENKVDSITQ
jgi:hypothetical protein